MSRSLIALATLLALAHTYSIETENWPPTRNPSGSDGPDSTSVSTETQRIKTGVYSKQDPFPTGSPPTRSWHDLPTSTFSGGSSSGTNPPTGSDSTGGFRSISPTGSDSTIYDTIRTGSGVSPSYDSTVATSTLATGETPSWTKDFSDIPFPTTESQTGYTESTIALSSETIQSVKEEPSTGSMGPSEKKAEVEAEVEEKLKLLAFVNTASTGPTGGATTIAGAGEGQVRITTVQPPASFSTDGTNTRTDGDMFTEPASTETPPKEDEESAPFDPEEDEGVPVDPEIKPPPPPVDQKIMTPPPISPDEGDKSDKEDEKENEKEDEKKDEKEDDKKDDQKDEKKDEQKDDKKGKDDKKDEKKDDKKGKGDKKGKYDKKGKDDKKGKYDKKGKHDNKGKGDKKGKDDKKDKKKPGHG